MQSRLSQGEQNQLLSQTHPLHGSGLLFGFAADGLSNSHWLVVSDNVKWNICRDCCERSGINPTSCHFSLVQSLCSTWLRGCNARCHSCLRKRRACASFMDVMPWSGTYWLNSLRIASSARLRCVRLGQSHNMSSSAWMRRTRHRPGVAAVWSAANTPFGIATAPSLAEIRHAGNSLGVPEDHRCCATACAEPF